MAAGAGATVAAARSAILEQQQQQQDHQLLLLLLLPLVVAMGSLWSLWSLRLHQVRMGSYGLNMAEATMLLLPIDKNVVLK